MSHIHLYMNSPTAGAIDGTEISSGNQTQPLTFSLNAAENESAALKAAVRCETGFQLQGDCSIYLTGSNAEKWNVALDNGFSDATTALTFADWQDTITLSDVSTVNAIFWIRATSSSDEAPQNDTSVSLHADGIVIQI